jgi:high affinity sulfate transporter 1
MLNIRAWAEKYVPRLRAAREGGNRPGEKDEENPRPTEDVPLLSKAAPRQSGVRRTEDEDWSQLYNFDLPHGTSEPYVPKIQHRLSLKDKIKTRFHYYIPIFSWLPKYDVKNQLLRDVLAGVGVGAMLLPQALSYAILAGLPVVNGLLTAFVPLVMYFFFGTSRQLSIGPDAMSSLLVGITISSPDNAAWKPEQLAPLLSFFVGCFLLGLGLFRVGFLDNILSRPLLAGFVNAVSITIFMEQLEPLFGVPGSKEHGWRKALSFFKHIDQMNWVTFGVAAVSIWILAMAKWAKSRWPKIRVFPETILVVVLSLLVSHFGKFHERFGIAILQTVPRGFKTPAPPALNLTEAVTNILPDALLISIVGFVEHIVIAKVYAVKHNYQISPNRELVALGASNLMGSFFNTYPTFGAITRSSVADALGATSQVFTLVAATIILLTMLFMGPLFYDLPRGAMAAIITVASIGLFELHDLIFLFRIRAWKELAQLVITFILTIALGLELGIFISLGISIFFIIKHTTYPHITILGNVPDTDKYKDVAQHETIIYPDILIVRIEDPLYFANVEQVKTLFMRIERLGDIKAHPGEEKQVTPLHAIIVHAANIPSMDASAIQVIHEMMKDYKERNIFVCWVKLRDNLKRPFLLSGIISALDGDRLFSSTHDAVKYVQSVQAHQRIQPLEVENSRWTSHADEDSSMDMNLTGNTFNSTQRAVTIQEEAQPINEFDEEFDDTDGTQTDDDGSIAFQEQQEAQSDLDVTDPSNRS